MQIIIYSYCTKSSFPSEKELVWCFKAALTPYARGSMCPSQVFIPLYFCVSLKTIKMIIGNICMKGGYKR